MLIKLMITLLNKSALAPNKTAKTIPSGISAIAMRVIPLIISTTELTYELAIGECEANVDIYSFTYLFLSKN